MFLQSLKTAVVEDNDSTDVEDDDFQYEVSLWKEQ